MWAEQNIQFGIKNKNAYPDPQDDELVVEMLFKKFNWSYITGINFMGGEPLISKTVTLVMERLINMKIASNVTLWFTTNGSTLITGRQRDLFLQFKELNFSYSIDGIGDQFHYLRYPLSWEKLQRSVDSAKELGKHVPVNVGVNMTVGALNIFSVDQVQEWAKTLTSNITIPTCNGVLGTMALPGSAREMLRKKYSYWPELVNRLRGTYSPVAKNELLDWLNMWDQRRGLDWRKVFPEAAFYIDR
jgi:hypothetical protein